MNTPELLNFFKTLGDADRLKIAGCLSNQPQTLGELAAKLELRPAEVSRHLTDLMALGVVQQDGNTYRLEAGAIEKMARNVLAQARPPHPADQFEGDPYDRKVLAAYFEADGTLKALPTQHKKLMVILRYLVQNFEVGPRYPEKQVNEILRKYHEDTAALRRYMVDNGLLARENGIYWKPETPAAPES